MSTIGGPGGIGGPKGPSGTDGPDGPDGIDAPDGADRPGGADAAAQVGAGIERAGATTRSPDIDAMSAEVAAGRLTAREAIEQLVEAAAGPELDPAERAELREMLTDLVANDPYLGALARQV